MTRQLVVHECDDLDRQCTERRVGEHTRSSEGRSYIRLEFGRHQRGGESLSADVGAQDRHPLRVDDDDIVQIAAHDSRRLVDRSQLQTRNRR